jgi:hypothetical protein
LRVGAAKPTMSAVEPSELVDRQELTAMLFSIADIRVNVRVIRELLEEELGGEEGLPEDDA